MKNINITLINKTSQTICIMLSHPLLIYPCEEIILPIQEYILYKKDISNLYFNIKFNDEYQNILRQINDFSNKDIEYYVLLNENLTTIQKNTLLLTKEMI